MKIPTLALGLVLGAALLGAAKSPAALADDPAAPVTAVATVDASAPAPAAAPAQSATDAEAREYERREAESPDAQEFTGGDGGLVALVLVVGILVLAYLFLKKEGKI